MATRKPLTLITGSPNKIQEMPGTDTLDPVSASLTGSFVGTTDTQTLTNKTLSSPKVTGSILDANGLEAIDITATIGAVNQLVVENSVGTDPVVISTAGDAVTGSINIAPKNGGAVQVNGSDLITASSTSTLTNKTHTNPRIVTSVDTHNCAISATTPGGSICDESGNTVLAILDPGTAGAYLGVRNQTDTTGGSVSMVACAPTAADINIYLQPKGAGSLIVRRSGGVQAIVLNRHDFIQSTDFRSISVPPGSPAVTTYLPGAMALYGPGTDTSITQANCDANVLWMFPFVAPRNGSSSVLVSGFTMCTGAANNGVGNVRAGIYSDAGSTNIYPGASGTSLVAGSEVVQAIPATADTIITNTSMTASLTPGELYWMVFVFDVATFEMMCYAPSVPRLNLTGARPTTLDGGAAVSGFYNRVSAGTFYTGFLVNFVYGALPSNMASYVASFDRIPNTNSATTPNLMHQIIFGS